MARQHVAKEAAAQLELREWVLAATKHDTRRIKAELDHARHVAQQSTYLETSRVATLARATKKEVRKAA